MEQLRSNEIKKLNFAIYKNNYVTLRNIMYKNIYVPKGFIFDGVTVKSPFTFIFNSKDLRNGILASCFHDYMCKNKSEYDRKYATDILVSLWKKEGLSSFKSFIVKISVNIFQFFKGGWKSGDFSSFKNNLIKRYKNIFQFFKRGCKRK